MKKLVLIFLLTLVSFGLFAESLYYKKYKNGEISLVKEKNYYILKTDEIKSDTFNYITIIEIKYESMTQEFIWVLENNCKNGNYYDFIESAYDDDKDDLELIEKKSYYKNNNLVLETRYRCDVE